MRKLTTSNSGATSWEDEIIISNQLKKGYNACIITVRPEKNIDIYKGTVIEADGVMWVCDASTMGDAYTEFTGDGFITFSNGEFTLIDNPTDIISGNWDGVKNGWYYNGKRIVAKYTYSTDTLEFVKTKIGKQI